LSIAMLRVGGIQTLQQLVTMDWRNIPASILPMGPASLISFCNKAKEIINLGKNNEEDRERKEMKSEEKGYVTVQDPHMNKMNYRFIPPKQTSPPQQVIFSPPPIVSTAIQDPDLSLSLEESIATYLREGVKVEDVNPESSVNVMEGISNRLMDCLTSLNVFTIRQLATSEIAEMSEFSSLGTRAKEILNFYESLAKEKRKLQTRNLQSPLYVAHYVSESVYQQLIEEKILKSSHVLYREYNECTPEARTLHAWKRIFNLYVKDAAKWVNGGALDQNSLSDVDVYSFLVWRASSSFAQFDCTAGPRAIYFCWKPMPQEKREDCLMIDQIIAEDVRDPYIADRFARVVYIDLRKLCTKYHGKVYRVEINGNDTQVNTNHWIPTPLELIQNYLTVSSECWWKDFEPGNRYFEKVPHGCVVTPSGTIPWDCVQTE